MVGKKTLGDLVTDKQKLNEMLDDPDIDDQVIFDTLDGVDFSIVQKLENSMKFIASLQHRDEAIGAETVRLQSRRRVMANRVKRLKGYIAFNLLRLNEPRIETDFHTFRMQAGRDTVEIDNLDELPDEYVQITRTADRTKIKNALKEGAQIKGARLVKSADFLVIR